VRGESAAFQMKPSGTMGMHAADIQARRAIQLENGVQCLDALQDAGHRNVTGHTHEPIAAVRNTILCTI
jgi:hypothetical protein